MDEIWEAWDGSWTGCEKRFIRAAVEAVEEVPKAAVEVAGSLLSSLRCICTHRTGSDS